MELRPKRAAPEVRVGGVTLGGGRPVVVQSMTDTPTADVETTLRQVKDLADAGSELVRLTVNDDAAAAAVPEIVRRLRVEGYATPLVGDFHFNGHRLLTKYPDTAQALAKYRINPGNVGKGGRHDENFAAIIRVAMAHDKPVRIGVNWGSLDPELLARLMDENACRPEPLSAAEVTYAAMIDSALTSAQAALDLGLPKDHIVLSVKMSVLQDMVTVYSRLARECDFALHLGLTEAGGDVAGIASSAAALGILLQQGIGDTIRVSLTPQPGIPRRREVEVCKAILQAMCLRYFAPSVTSCPGCGRTSSDFFQHLARDINTHIQRQMPEWKAKYPGVERLKIAVMGCVVNGPGESRHADIGISLPGASEQPLAPVYIDGKEFTILKGSNIREEFLSILETYIKNKWE